MENGGAFKMLAVLLDVNDEDQLSFIMDCLTCNPYRIFKCETPFPKIDLAKLRSNAEFDHNRLILIADLLECNKSTITKFANKWISSYNDLL